MRRWSFWLTFSVAAAMTVPLGRAQSEDGRIGLLKEQIQSLGKVVEAAKNGDEKARLAEKLKRMQQELTILQERQSIEVREQALQQTRTQSSLDLLRDKLRALDHTQEEAEAGNREVLARRQVVSRERNVLAEELAGARAVKVPDLGHIADLEERLSTKNEELRTLALQREANESVIDLAAAADRLREQLKLTEGITRPNLRVLFESYTRMRTQQKNTDQSTALSADRDQNLRLSQSALELAQEKLARFDDELAVLEKQTSFFHRDAKVEQFLAAERNQKQVLLARLPLAAAEVDAIKRSQDAAHTQQDLNTLGATVEREQFVGLKDAYLRRLRWPGLAMGILLILNIVLTYAVLPAFYQHEGLFLARRLTRYAFALAAALVVAAFLFEDLSMVAATLGIVSAALVISLQDVCTSVCGWFVIMAGGKFHIGDRLEIDGTRGDVLDIQLLRTTLIEICGWLGVDQPTGRVFLVPNNVIFKSKIFNYTHGHPYVWGKLDVTITFTTPVATAMAFLQQVLEDETRATMVEAHRAASVMQRRYGVEDAVYEPKIYTAIGDSGVVYSLFYVAHYRQFSEARARLSHKILIGAEAHPEIQLAYPTINILRSSTDIPIPKNPSSAPA